MVWEVQLVAPDGREDVCSSLLETAGSMGAVMEWTPDASAKVRVKGYFPDTMKRDDVELRLRLLLLADAVTLTTDGMQWRHLPDQDWAEAWKKDLKPFPVGQRFLIRPSWWPNEETTRLVVTMDPGLAFGSGSHETTSGCLEAMEWISEKKNLGAFLDMGCGSGILAMGASLLGATSITASDLDPQAITTSKENFLQNSLDTIVTLLSSDVPRGPFDTIVANILSGVLLDKASDLVRELRPGGHLILAGLLDQQHREVLVAYLSLGVLSEKIYEKSPWIILVLAKP
ncbi:MAG: Ribosomal protein L11 methyltransferase [Magnetococcales bacterium]|nr:Ribosomal protein L11 methyltransferase [Magnetococcales bacterium]HIJ85115.1 50S ribosomal protein L11 methyltransferase [Magnetococcales bacterium]